MKQFLLAAAVVLTSSSIARAQAVNVTLSEWKVELSRDTVQAGPVTFHITNKGTITHSFYVRGNGVAKGAKEMAPQEPQTFTVALKPGTYEVYCPLSDLSHRQAGMTHKLVVVAADATKKP